MRQTANSSLSLSPDDFDLFYLNISSSWTNPSNAPFSSDCSMEFLEPIPQGPLYDYVPVKYTLNNDLQNDIISPSISWHTGNSTLPESTVHPFYITSNRGPKYLQRRLGQVVASVMTTRQSSGNYTMTIDTIVMRRKLVNETIACHRFDKVQVFVVLEEQLTINMIDQTVSMSTGDVTFVPPSIDFQYWSDVAFTKFYLGSNGLALTDMLISGGERWDYAVFPSYLG